MPICFSSVSRDRNAVKLLHVYLNKDALCRAFEHLDIWDNDSVWFTLSFNLIYREQLKRKCQTCLNKARL